MRSGCWVVAGWPGSERGPAASLVLGGRTTEVKPAVCWPRVSWRARRRGRERKDAVALLGLGSPTRLSSQPRSLSQAPRLPSPHRGPRAARRRGQGRRSRRVAAGAKRSGAEGLDGGEHGATSLLRRRTGRPEGEAKAGPPAAAARRRPGRYAAAGRHRFRLLRQPQRDERAPATAREAPRTTAELVERGSAVAIAGGRGRPVTGAQRRSAAKGGSRGRRAAQRRTAKPAAAARRRPRRGGKARAKPATTGFCLWVGGAGGEGGLSRQAKGGAGGKET